MLAFDNVFVLCAVCYLFLCGVYIIFFLLLFIPIYFGFYCCALPLQFGIRELLHNLFRIDCRFVNFSPPFFRQLSHFHMKSQSMLEHYLAFTRHPSSSCYDMYACAMVFVWMQYFFLCACIQWICLLSNYRWKGWQSCDLLIHFCSSLCRSKDKLFAQKKLTHTRHQQQFIFIVYRHYSAPLSLPFPSKRKTNV